MLRAGLEYRLSIKSRPVSGQSHEAQTFRVSFNAAAAPHSNTTQR